MTGDMLREIAARDNALLRADWSRPPVHPSEAARHWADMVLDPVVGGALETISSAILHRPPAIAPADPSAAAAAAAELLPAWLANIDLEGALDDALSALWRGFAVHEITWRHANGRFHLASLADISADQIAFDMDAHARIIGAVNQPQAAPAQRISADKLWIHRHRPSRQRPAGASLLDRAYRAWRAKDNLLRFWGLALQRYGMTQWIVRLPANTPAATQQAIIDQLHQLRLDGIASVPDSVVIERHDPAQWANLTYETAIAYQDAEIQRGILLALASSGTAGSTYTTGQGIAEQRDPTGKSMARISRALCRSFELQVLAPLTLANLGPAAPSPRLALAAPAKLELPALGPPLAALVAAGITTPAAAADELGLPPPPEATP